MLNKALSRTCPASRNSFPPCYHGILRRRVCLASAQQLTTAQAAAAVSRQDGDNTSGKPVIPVQVTRPNLPCDKPLPLASVLEVQRLLFLLEAPEYCMRAFREHGVNGQDLLHMQEEDLDDSRFKFPRHVQRKVMRIPLAWRAFLAISGSSTQGSISREQYVAFYGSEELAGSSPAVLAELHSCFGAVDLNSNGCLSFEEFLVGFSLLHEPVATKPRQQALAA
ncbi:hypothetical protein Agub_g878 [Astrephomene gubernaculifera]|uniref:EF-hand domain-containing protein n=1 Tax=Astrephomene gubernaculifera TaxID=47775 RepID=A0AAD3DI03_9CHLO|nr:hypothetical protein Agub_g878 [Astrephomene gubernaculifera]